MIIPTRIWPRLRSLSILLFSRIPKQETFCWWAEELGETAELVASKLEDEGYFGPVCMDAFS